VALEALEGPAAPLLRAAAAGDRAAFGALYDRYVDAVYRRVAFKLREPADAEDVTARVFEKAFRQIAAFRPERAPFLGWLFTIADRLIIDHYRTRKSTAPLEAALSIPAPESVEREVEQRLAAEEMCRAMAQLQERQQDVLLLRFVHGYDVRESAALLGKSEGAVRVSQHRALLALRRQLAAIASVLG